MKQKETSWKTAGDCRQSPKKMALLEKDLAI